MVAARVAGVPTFAGHRLAEFLIVDQKFSRTFHGGKEGGFRETRGRAGLLVDEFHGIGSRGFVF